MAVQTSKIKGKATFAHGIHPPEHKTFSADQPIEVMPTPPEVLVPLIQNPGAPSEAIINSKQAVQMGELIAESTGFVSANHHAPINGTTKRLGMTTLANGRHVKVIPIVAAETQLEGQALFDEVLGGDWPLDGVEAYDAPTIAGAVNAAGIVGLGGAAFPTHVKLARNEEKPVQTLLINGCECEPYLTTDYRVMVEAPQPIVLGAQLAAKAMGAKEIIIAIEDNKPEAAAVLGPVARVAGVRLEVLKTKYPQGAEKNLIQAIIKKEVPMGGLPMDVGVAVSNVGTAAAIARAVVRGNPLTHRVITVTGRGIRQPKNLLVPIGVSFRRVVEYCGGLTPDAARMIAGGPMMGFAFADLDTVVTKGSSGLTVLSAEDVRSDNETACVRCGKCVKACPMNLVPAKLAAAARNGDGELAERYHIMACFECGCCTYACPARIKLMQHIRVQKARIAMAKRN